jgi:serine/threonine-protein kinase RsbT
MEDDIAVSIRSDQDIVVARQKGRSLAMALEFSPGDATLIATAISELARNIVAYATKGEQALRDGFSTSGSLGLGLPGVRRLVDEFHIHSEKNRGTTVTVRKWKP